MKVLHFASGDTWGGAERVVATLLEALRLSGHHSYEVLLLNEGRLADVVRGLGAPLTIVPEESCGFAELVRRVRPLLREAGVVHAHRYKEILACALGMGRVRGRLVVTIHGLQPLSQLGVVPWLQVWGALLLARLRGARFATVSSELHQRLARVLGSGHVSQIPNPAPQLDPSARTDDVRARFGWERERPLVGFVGRLEAVKGPDTFLRIAAAADPAAAFVLVGEGAMEDELVEEVERAGLQDRVGLLGAVPDAMPIVQQLDVLALPSRHEGMPMVLLEAAVLGVPVVAFDVGGVGQVLDGGPAARLVPADDVETFAREISRVLAAGDALADAIEAWAAPVRERYSLRAVAARYEALYEGAVAEP